MSSTVVQSQFPRRRAGDAQIEKIAALFKVAEAQLKKAEQQNRHLLIPSLNELRYAGHHILAGLTSENSGQADYEFQEAESHCRRAIFDAIEIRLLDHIQHIETAEEDYKSIEVSKVIINYVELRGKFLNVKEALRNINFSCREDYIEECEVHLEHLERFSSILDRAKPELQKAIVKDRFNTLIALGGLSIGFLTLVAAIVAAVTGIMPLIH